MNKWGWFDTIWYKSALVILGLRQHFYRVSEEQLRTNPTRFIADFCERMDARIDLTHEEPFATEEIEEIVSGICEDLPGLLPYKSSIRNFVTNKVARETKKQERGG